MDQIETHIVIVRRSREPPALSTSCFEMRHAIDLFFPNVNREMLLITSKKSDDDLCQVLVFVRRFLSSDKEGHLEINCRFGVGDRTD